MEIVEAKTFGNEEGKKIMGFIPIDPKTLEVDPEGEIAFNGEVIVGTNMGPMSLTFEFPEGYSLEKCFEEFERCADEEVEARKKEMQEQSRIVTPDQLNSNTPQIVTP